ncbi:MULTISPECIES: ATP-dependent Clp protease proteolytic subunit [unclassified Pseudomonas]|uniref:SDH family Clp fold serine proteinase n=1 Tax=unclassified Pseudomonas TaxID=196821 RepID=UPI001179A42E|nr:MULTISPECIES: ATP-dependent Clp protease proteolytic subunit [unclassified Pseudomonas]
MTIDTPSEDLENLPEKPARERSGSAGEGEAPLSEGIPTQGSQSEVGGEASHGEGESLNVGPMPLNDFIKEFVQSVHSKLRESSDPQNADDAAASAAAEGLDGVVEISEFRPKAKASQARKAWKSPSVTALVKKGLEGENLIELIEQEVFAIIDSHAVLDDYEVVFLYDHTLINRTHASAVYQRLLDCDSKKNVLLVLKSPGGQVEPAYLISKLCRRKSTSKFLVCVPGEAKSAATLLSLGADEIHMGAMSELGPIDPQINEYPALAFSSALDKIAQLAEKYPGASDMLAKYLIGSGMDVQALGHYDRIAESYSQYAISLLDSKKTDMPATPVIGRKSSQELANYFTNHYKDHNFVIDVDEARKQLGSEVVVLESNIYQACHEIHKFLESCEIALTLQKHARRISVLGNKFILRRP